MKSNRQKPTAETITRETRAMAADRLVQSLRPLGGNFSEMSQETGEKIVDVLLRSAIEDSGSEKGPSPSYGLDYLESSSLVDG